MIEQQQITVKERILYGLGWVSGRTFVVGRFLLSHLFQWAIHFVVGMFQLVSTWFSLFMKSPFIAIGILALGIGSSIRVLNHFGFKI